MPIKKQISNLAEGAGRAIKKIGAPAVLACATGCEPSVELLELTPAMHDQVAESLRVNEQNLPIYELLFKKLNQTATFDAGDGTTAQDTFTELKTAHALSKKLLEEGKIFAYEKPAEDDLSGLGDADDYLETAGGYFHSSLIAEEQYIGMPADPDADELYDYGDDVYLHEAAHAKKGHSQEIDSALSTNSAYNPETNRYSRSFVRLVVEQRDFSYLVSLVGPVIKPFRFEANLEQKQLHDALAEFKPSTSWTQYRPQDDLYECYSKQLIALPQDEWAEAVLDDSDILDWDYIDILGLTREDLIDVFSKETSIYPEAHKEYMQNLEDFKREWMDEKENTEAELPEETDEEVMEDEEDEGSVEGEEGSYGGQGRR